MDALLLPLVLFTYLLRHHGAACYRNGDRLVPVDAMGARN